MKKSLAIAVSMLAFTGVVRAESSVSLYGILDTGYAYTNYKYDHKGEHARSTSSGLRNEFLNSNRWGLKGSEDLGNGLKAIFTLESKFKLGDGSGKGGFNRKSFVGLSSDSWGTFTMGRQKTISDDFNGANTVKAMGKTARAFGGAGTTVDNMFKYVSPSIAGLQAGLSFATNGTIERNTDVDDQNRDNYIGVGLRYKNGPWAASATYDRMRDSNKNDYVVHNWMLAAAYDFDVLKLSLAYGQDRNGKLKKAGDVSNDIFGAKDKRIGAYNAQGFKSYNYFVGISAPVASGILGVSWTHTRGNLGNVYYKNEKNHIDTQAQNIYAANYRYPLSKRTTLVAYGAYGTGIAYLQGFKFADVGIGLNHKF